MIASTGLRVAEAAAQHDADVELKYGPSLSSPDLLERRQSEAQRSHKQLASNDRSGRSALVDHHIADSQLNECDLTFESAVCVLQQERVMVGYGQTRSRLALRHTL